jgi:hypothetical protein
MFSKRLAFLPIVALIALAALPSGRPQTPAR